MRAFPDECIDCIVTSPPYWQLRDYGWKQQWGLEKTFAEYLGRLWQFMDEAKRILKPQGTVWINLGDTYFGSGNDRNSASGNLRSINARNISPAKANTHPDNKLRRKSQVLIPHRFIIGCAERGWIVRNDIIWAKPNGLPESVNDRFSKKHEHIFLLVKNEKYHFDLNAVREAHKASSIERVKQLMTAYGGDSKNKKVAIGKGAKNGGTVKKVKLNPLGKNPGDVTDFWTISTKPGSRNHYATFNTELIEKPVLAGCPIGGIVLDPFCGSGTTGVFAIEHGRNFIGIDGKKEYCKIAKENILQAEKLHFKNIINQLQTKK